MLISGLDTYFLEVSAHALLKVATKGSFRRKKCENLAFLDYFCETKRRSPTKKTEVSVRDLASLYLAQLHIFWK